MLEIVKEPTESLRQPSKELDADFILSDEIQKLLKEMTLTMYQDDGIGLAAPQVGKNIRICVIGKEANLDSEDDLILINPVWQKTSRRKLVDIEGCLSVPKTYGKVKRYKSIHVEALNKKGDLIEFEAQDFLARVIQHEVDHLNGLLS